MLSFRHKKQASKNVAGTTFKIAKRIGKTNQNIIGEQCIRNDDGVLAFSDEDKKVTWKSLCESLLNTDFTWNGNSLS